MTRPDRRHALLAAAARVVQAHGTDRLTLEAVAAEAGTSKGGLLYHFPTKDALIAGLVETMVDGFDARLAALRTGDAAGSFAAAYLAASVTPEPHGATAVGLLAAVTQSPALLDPLRARYRAWDAALANDGLAPGAAWLLRLALDGLWVSHLFGLGLPSDEDFGPLLDRMTALATPLDPEKAP